MSQSIELPIGTRVLHAHGRGYIIESLGFCNINEYRSDFRYRVRFDSGYENVYIAAEFDRIRLPNGEEVRRS